MFMPLLFLYSNKELWTAYLFFNVKVVLLYELKLLSNFFDVSLYIFLKSIFTILSFCFIIKLSLIDCFSSTCIHSQRKVGNLNEY